MPSFNLFAQLGHLCLFLFIFFAVGCSQMQALPHPAEQPPPLNKVQQTQQGQLSIKLHAWQSLPAKGISLGFFFSGTPHEGLLDLMTPLGTHVAQVGWNNQEAWTINQDGRRNYGNLDELSAAALGEALPLLSLTHWMNGRPDPAQATTHTDVEGVFEQSGWRIDTREYTAQRIQASRESTETHRGIHIKIYLDR